MGAWAATRLWYLWGPSWGGQRVLALTRDETRVADRIWNASSPHERGWGRAPLVKGVVRGVCVEKGHKFQMRPDMESNPCRR